ncbi:methyltransferase [Microbacterium marinilacus]|uniref:Methyltransferase n=1 Tax=Microbacterium marinilacus TaxID=415209 RepID=A0ABP7B2N0_9MICO|nr:methyltransferase [Microbacterium marinilacus]MBY0688011.1 methyltransferase [Microbacterium marinilacus]
MTTTHARRLYVAYGPAGAVGIVREVEDGRFAVTMAGADAPVGEYAGLDVAKNALVSHLRPGSGRPEFRQH